MPSPASGRGRKYDGLRFRHSPHHARSASSRAIAARSSGMPAPLRAEVASTSGNAAGCFASAAVSVVDARRKLGGLHLVGLGQHDLIVHRRLVERLEHRIVGRFEPMPGVDQR